MIVLAAGQILVIAFIWFTLFSFYRNRQHLPMLKDLGWQKREEGVLIVVPAKDEEESVAACLEGLVQLRGLSNFKIIAVNDRSEDRTEERMLEVAAKYPGLIEVASVKHLPEGWLGKNHACWFGVKHGLNTMPDAKYFLFADGDVKFHPDTLVESMTYMERDDLDYLTLIEHSEYEGFLEPAYLLMFGIFLIVFTSRPWMLFKKGGRNFFGNGAYILMRRDAYQATGGHQTLRLEVVEDMRMGLLMRSSGFRCAAAIGLGRIRRRWQPGFSGLFRGLLKNLFAGFEYSVPLAVVGIASFPLIMISPWILVFSKYWIVGAASLVTLAVCFYVCGRNSGLPWLTSFLLAPITSLTGSANVATSMYLTLKNRGVSWRGTHYAIETLREHCFTIRKAFNRTGTNEDLLTPGAS